MKLKSTYKKQYKALLECLRMTRENKNITQSQLAELLGTKQATISKIETGERRIDFIEILNFCTALDIEMQDFIALFQEILQKYTKI